MTVPPLFGWEEIATVLVLLLVVAAAFFVASAAGRAPSGRSEFQAWLDARSIRYAEPPDGPSDEPADAPRSANATGGVPGAP